MRVGEGVEQAILGADPATRFGRARLKAAVVARRALVRLRDPLVRYRIGEVELELPLSHPLPFYRNDHAEYDRPLGIIAAELGGPVVDVGANVGDTAATIRAETDVPVLCVEGDDWFFSLLERNAPRLGDVELEPAFVSAPERGRVERENGTARVLPGDEDLPTKSLAEVLEEHPRFERPALVKLDTDGFDVPIVLESLDVLVDRKPVLFFEYDPHLGAEPVVFEQLHAAGYRRADWFENTGAYRTTVPLPRHLHEFVGYDGARYADVCVRP